MISVINFLLEENTNTIFDYSELLQESIPWRSGEVPIKLIKTDVDRHSYDGFVLNNLKMFLKLKPSFMILVPKISNIESPGDGTNGYIIIARQAQQLNYKTIATGTCYAKMHFFGRPKQDRAFDIFFRAFERGFSIENIDGIPGFENATIEITCKKKDFSHESIIAGRLVKGSIIKTRQKESPKFSADDLVMIRCRVTRVK